MDYDKLANEITNNLPEGYPESDDPSQDALIYTALVIRALNKLKKNKLDVGLIQSFATFRLFRMLVEFRKSMPSNLIKTDFLSKMSRVHGKSKIQD